MSAPSRAAGDRATGEPPGAQAHRSMQRQLGGLIYQLGWWIESAKPGDAEIDAEVEAAIRQIKLRAEEARNLIGKK